MKREMTWLVVGSWYETQHAGPFLTAKEAVDAAITMAAERPGHVATIYKSVEWVWQPVSAPTIHKLED